MKSRPLLLLLFLLLLLGCSGEQYRRQSASAAAAAQARGAERIAVFSQNPAGGLPDFWSPLIILRTKKPTQYRLVSDQGKTVLHAHAAQASSGLMHHVELNPTEYPWLRWRWKVGSMVDTVDSTKRATEDSPARVMLGFDGDKASLPFADQVLFETAKLLTGHEFPYATLMYIWDRNTPVGTVMSSYRSGRIKMIVVANGAKGVAQWQDFTRNIIADFEQAFGEKPGKLIGVGVLTDTDNLGETVEAWYGDISLRRR